MPKNIRFFNADKMAKATSSETVTFLMADFYATRLGFFCKQEIKMDKITTIPFRFRLGSVEQCNWFEGKLKRF